MKVVAIQLESKIADVAENLSRCEQLGDEAGSAGAEWIILPEFFHTGMGYIDSMAETALPANGDAMGLLKRLAKRHNAIVAALSSVGMKMTTTAMPSFSSPGMTVFLAGTTRTFRRCGRIATTSGGKTTA